MTRREPKFLNLDLDVESREPLGRLADALPSLLVLFSGRVRGRHMLSMELSDPALLVDPTVRHMARTISRLSGEPKRLWQRATKRCFNIGFACGTRHAPSFLIDASSIQAIAALDATLAIKLYPAENGKRMA